MDGKLERRIAFIFKHNRISTAVKAVAAGVREQALATPRCDFRLMDISPRSLQLLDRSHVDGALVAAVGLPEDVDWLAEARQRGIPIVHAGELPDGSDMHEVRSPNHLLGRQGAQHLVGRGLRSFAFIGNTLYVSRQRCDGFVAALTEAGITHIATHFNADLDADAESLAPFLRQLQRPCGIMAGSDKIGWLIGREALLLGLRIPEQIALVSVGNDEPWCSLASPPLSSIDVPGLEIGRRALMMLDDLMSGRPTARQIDVPAGHLTERQSTAVLHGQSREISAAIGYIRQQRGRGISVRDVADFAGISISTLERGIKQVLGCRPLQEIRRLRLQSAAELLSTTDLSMKVIAQRCGFRDGKQFATAIRDETGLSPTQYRAQRRGPL